MLDYNKSPYYIKLGSIGKNMPVQLNKHNLLGIAGTLVKKGLLSEIDAKMVLDRTQNASFVTSVVKEKLVSSYAIAHAVAEEFCYPILDLNALKLDQTLIELVGENFLRKQLENYHKKNKSLALPIFKRGNSLFLAVSDPENQEVLAEIRFSAKM
ncbi:MAG: hypothetical protein KAI17_06315, partial [Thiotrichaceae bacterium]|nr:hypothetical protein [Thiotrichaceae bacterium]